MPRAAPDPAFRYDAGTPWLDLLATAGGAYGPEPVERMRGLPELVAWLDHQHLTPQEPPTAADVGATRALREALRPVVLASVAGSPLAPAALDALQPWLDRADPPRPLVREGRIALPPPATTQAALAALARHAVEFLADPGHVRLGACADDDCHMAFLDPSGKRRWCASNRCGVRARVRAHRARQS